MPRSSKPKPGHTAVCQTAEVVLDVLENRLNSQEDVQGVILDLSQRISHNCSIREVLDHLLRIMR